MDRLLKEAVEIRLNFSNFNRDGGFVLSRACCPALNMLGDHKAGTGRASR
jgi:hypothetical protein